MTSIASLCTIATEGCLRDLKVLLNSLSLSQNTLPLLVMSDETVDDYLQSIHSTYSFPIKSYPDLRKYDAKGVLVQGREFWIELMSKKADIIATGILIWGNTLYLDSDIVVLQPCEKLSFAPVYDLVLSHHDINTTVEKKYGKYNAGWMWVKNETFPIKWKQLMLSDPNSVAHIDQKCLDTLSHEYSTGLIDFCHNVGWWRLLYNPPAKYLDKLTLDSEGELAFGNEKIYSLHTHFKDNIDLLEMRQFNNIVLSKLKNSTSPKVQKLIAVLQK